MELFKRKNNITLSIEIKILVQYHQNIEEDLSNEQT